MVQEYFIGRAEITENNQQIKLEYNIIEEKRDLCGASLYGILIKMEIKEKGLLKKEQGGAKAISYSRNWVEKLVRIFLKNTVTPMCMDELIDEYITREGLSA